MDAKTVYDEMLSKMFLNDAYEIYLLWNVIKMFSKQTFTKHCHQMLFKCFIYTVYHTFNDEYLKNISCITFISWAIL